MVEVERLKQILADLSDALGHLQNQIERTNELLVNATQVLSDTPSSTPRASPSLSKTRIQYLEKRVDELEASERDLAMHLEDILQRHRACETEVSNAVLAREAIMRRYRHLVKVAIDLLRALTQTFPPDEDLDEETRRAVEEDLKRGLRSPSTATSSSSTTARPSVVNRSRNGDPNNGGDGMDVVDVDGHRMGPGGVAGSDHLSSAGSQLSAVSHSTVVGEDEDIPTWAIHNGSKCPGCVKMAAGPFENRDFSKLGFDENELDGIFQGLILPRDVSCRLAAPPSPRTLRNIQLVFLYDPLFLESGARTYILDWGTAQANREIINWLSPGNREFHTFIFPSKKKRWYYFGGLNWNPVSFNDVWPTLNDESCVSVLQQLSQRSHNTMTPAEITRQLADGELQQLCIEIGSTNEMGLMREIANKLGGSPRVAKTRRLIVRGEQ